MPTEEGYATGRRRVYVQKSGVREISRLVVAPVRAVGSIGVGVRLHRIIQRIAVASLQGDLAGKRFTEEGLKDTKLVIRTKSEPPARS